MRILLMYPPLPKHLEELQQVAPLAKIDVALTEEEAKEKIRLADAVLGNRYFLQALPLAEKLRWMQSNSSGVDLILQSPLSRLPFLLTSARGVYDIEVAEHALSLALGLARALHLHRDAQKQKTWRRFPLTQLQGARCLILGYGSIGRTIGQKLTALGAIVEGARRGSAWQIHLSGTDFFFAALPLTPLTSRLISHAIFNALPPHAFFINVGRGKTLDESALLETIRSDKLQGAALDVFEEEPLPPTHPFWSEDKILLTPHVARSPEIAPHQWEPLFVENLSRFYRGDPLLNQVDKERGYCCEYSQSTLGDKSCN